MYDLLAQKVHGHVAVLGAALCFHPWFALRTAGRPSGATRLAGYLASGGVVLANVLGWVIYPAYREEVKADLYRYARPVGLLFEVKEHLAWFALALAVAAATLMWMSQGTSGVGLRASVRTAYLWTGLLMTAVCAMGVWVSVHNGFSYAIR